MSMDESIDELTGEVLAPLATEVSPVIAAEINQQVVTAKRFPRRPDSTIAKEIESRAALNEEIAGECMYALKRGDKVITGPSIRFAEIVRASYGNIRVAARFVRLDLDDRARAAVIVEAVCLDLETNGAEAIPVRRSITTSPKSGAPRIYNADMINTTVNAGCSIARRNAILAVVPKAVWILAYQRAVAVIQGDGKTLEGRRNAYLGRLQEIGVTTEDVLAVLGVPEISDITLSHFPILAGIGNAIKEGESVDAVIGRMRPDDGRPAHTVVEHPLREPQPTNGQAQATEAAKTTSQVSAAPAREPAAAAAQGQPAGGDVAAVARDPEQARDPRPVTQTAEQGPERNVAAAQSDPTDKPTTEEQYKAHWLAFLAEANDAEEITAVWSGERKLRVACGVGDKVLSELTRARDSARAKLKGK